MGVGEFQPLGAERDGLLDQFRYARDVEAVQVDVQRERKTGCANGLGHVQFLGVRGHTGDPVRGVRVGILNAELDVFEAGRLEFGEDVPIQQRAASNQVGVQVAGPGVPHERNDVIAHQRLAAGQMHLHHAEFRGLSEGSAPLLGGEFGELGMEIDRVGAVHAFERAAVGQLGNDGVGSRRAHVGSRGDGPSSPVSNRPRS